MLKGKTVVATFEELMQLLENPGDDGLPDTFTTDLTTVYQDATSTRDARIAELAQADAEKAAELARVKSMNYDLMVASSTNTGENENNKGSVSDTDDIGDIDDLFE